MSRRTYEAAMRSGVLSDTARDTERGLRGAGHCAIITRYHGATNTRGARISATLAGEGRRPRVSIGFPYELNETASHMMAALALIEYMRHEEDAYAPHIVGAGAIRGGYAFIIETAPAY